MRRLLPPPFRLLLAIICGLAPLAHGEVSLPSIFGSHMVLQRDQENRIWGHAAPGEAVTVALAGQERTTRADSAGRWAVKLAPVAAGGPHTLAVSGTNRVVFEDVLFGEVWICSGQSNMQWPVERSNHAAVEIASANFPEIRLITVAQRASVTPETDFEGAWVRCTPETVADFSAIGYLFGRRLHHALGVPIGLIDNAWGGSAAEAWVPRDTFEKDDRYAAVLEHWDARVAAYTDAVHAREVADYEAWEQAGRPAPQRRRPNDIRVGQHCPANLYNGLLHPLVGYGIRGVIWYQGENNAPRAEQYRDLFPTLITTWRERWGQGDFPFYWVQLADFRAEPESPEESEWAELREAQTLTLALPHTGQAVIIDAGEGRDIHPRDKQTVAHRLVRLALARDHGFEMASQSPRYASMQREDGALLLTFDHVSEEGLRAFDVAQVKGFAVAGEDRVFHWADATIVAKNQIRVSDETVRHPVAVRYAWSDNPVANVQDRNGLPLTPFRTDDWPGLTTGRQF